MSDEFPISIDIDAAPAEKGLERIDAGLQKTFDKLSTVLHKFQTFGTEINAALTAVKGQTNELHAAIAAASGSGTSKTVGVNLDLTAARSQLTSIISDINNAKATLNVMIAREPLFNQLQKIRSYIETMNPVMTIHVNDDAIKKASKNIVSSSTNVEQQLAPAKTGDQTKASKEAQASAFDNRTKTIEGNRLDAQLQEYIREIRKEASSGFASGKTMESYNKYNNIPKIIVEEVIQRQKDYGVQPKGDSSYAHVQELRSKVLPQNIEDNFKKITNQITGFFDKIGVQLPRTINILDEIKAKSGMLRSKDSMSISVEKIKSEMTIDGGRQLVESVSSAYSKSAATQLLKSSASMQKDFADIFNASPELKSQYGNVNKFLASNITKMISGKSIDDEFKPLLKDHIIPKMTNFDQAAELEKRVKYGSSAIDFQGATGFGYADNQKVRTGEYNNAQAERKLEQDQSKLNRQLEKQLSDQEKAAWKAVIEARWKTADAMNIDRQLRTQLMDSERAIDKIIREQKYQFSLSEASRRETKGDIRHAEGIARQEANKIDNRQYQEAKELERQIRGVGKAQNTQGNAFEQMMQGARKGFIEWGLSMSGIAASIFVFQQVSAIIMEVSKKFDEATTSSAGFVRQIHMTRKEYESLSGFIDSTRKETGLGTDEISAAMVSLRRQGMSFEDAKKNAGTTAEMTKQGLTKNADEAANVMANDAFGARDGYKAFLELTDDTYTKRFEKLGAALDGVKKSFESAFGDSIKSSLDGLTGWINDNNGGILKFVEILKEAVKTIGMLTIGYTAFRTVRSLNQTGFIHNEVENLMQARNASLGSFNAGYITKFDAKKEVLAKQEGKAPGAFNIANLGTGLKAAGMSLGIGTALTAAAYAAEKLLENTLSLIDVYKNSEDQQKKFADSLGVTADQYKKMTVNTRDYSMSIMNAFGDGSISFESRLEEMSLAGHNNTKKSLEARKKELKGQLETIRNWQIATGAAWYEIVAETVTGKTYGGKNYKGKKETFGARETVVGGDKVKEINEEMRKIQSFQDRLKQWSEDNGDILKESSTRTYEEIANAHKSMYDQMGVTTSLYGDELISANKKIIATLEDMMKAGSSKMTYDMSEETKKRMRLLQSDFSQQTAYFTKFLENKLNLQVEYDKRKKFFETFGTNTEGKDSFFKADANLKTSQMNPQLASIGMDAKAIDALSKPMVDMFESGSKAFNNDKVRMAIEKMMQEAGPLMSKIMIENKPKLIESIAKTLEGNYSKDDALKLASVIAASVIPANDKKLVEDAIKKKLDAFLLTGTMDPSIANDYQKKASARMSVSKNILSNALIKDDAAIAVNNPDHLKKYREADAFLKKAEQELAGEMTEGKMEAFRESNKALIENFKYTTDLLLDTGKAQNDPKRYETGLMFAAKMDYINGVIKTEKQQKDQVRLKMMEFNKEKQSKDAELSRGLFNQGDASAYGGVKEADVYDQGVSLNKNVFLEDGMKSYISSIQGDLYDATTKMAGIDMAASTAYKYTELTGKGIKESIDAIVTKQMADLIKYSPDADTAEMFKYQLTKIKGVGFAKEKIEAFAKISSDYYTQTGDGFIQFVESNQKVSEFELQSRYSEATAKKMAGSNVKKEAMMALIAPRKDDMEAFVLASGKNIDTKEIFKPEIIETLKKVLGYSDEEIKTIGETLQDSSSKAAIDTLLKRLDTEGSSRSLINKIKEANKNRVDNLAEAGKIDFESQEKLNKLFDLEYTGASGKRLEAQYAEMYKIAIDTGREYFNTSGTMGKEVAVMETMDLNTRIEKFKAFGADSVQLERERQAKLRQIALSNAMFGEEDALYDGLGAEALKKAGFSEQSMASMTKGFTQFYDDTTGMMQRWQKFGTATAEGFENAIISACEGSTSSFREFIDNVGRDFATMIIKMQLNKFMTDSVNPIITGGIQGMTNFFSSSVPGASGSHSNSIASQNQKAKGGAYLSGGIEAFAKGGTFTNSIVSDPTYFKFAQGSKFGLGMMGEAGAEAIMPLARDNSGSLGVKMLGGNNNNQGINIEINVTNESGQAVEATKTDAKFDDLGNLVCNIVLSAISTNKNGMRSAVKQAAR